MKSKIDTNTVKNCNGNAIIAGLLIGLGVIINTQTKPPILGALLFSFGLLTIIHLKLPLYTGKIGYLKGKLGLILLFNLIGIGITVAAYCLCNFQFYELIHAAAEVKFAKTYLQMLLGGLFCGMLIHFAVKCKVPYLTSMAVIIFILIGAEHCIADFPFLILDFNFVNLLKLISIVLGNSIGAMIINFLSCE